MLSLEDVRQYISDMGIAEDSNIYIGKLDAKQEKSIGVYNRSSTAPPKIPLGGAKLGSYGVKQLSLLVHWNKSKLEAEKTANKLYMKLMQARNECIGEKKLLFNQMMVPEPQDVGTDDNGIYEYVIWLDLIYSKEDM